MQYPSPASLVIRQCPKLFFERFLPWPFILAKNTEGNLLSFSSDPAIRNNSRNKNTGNNSATLPVRGTGEKPRTRKENENSENEVRSKKESKQRWRRARELGRQGGHEVSRYLRQEIERKDKWRKNGGGGARGDAGVGMPVADTKAKTRAFIPPLRQISRSASRLVETIRI